MAFSRVAASPQGGRSRQVLLLLAPLDSDLAASCDFGSCWGRWPSVAHFTHSPLLPGNPADSTSRNALWLLEELRASVSHGQGFLCRSSGD